MAKIIKKTAVALHKTKECHCFNDAILNADKRCVYRLFVDGWDFTPDVGKGQARGEIFTPRWVVDKMAVDCGLLPPEAVYENDHESALVPGSSTQTDEDGRTHANRALECVYARVNEPAVGTANYTATILYHKLRYAYFESLDNSGNSTNDDINNDTSHEAGNGTVDLSTYHRLLLTAAASLYAFDIEVGNLQVTKQRFLGSNIKLNAPETVTYWQNYLKDWLIPDRDKPALIEHISDDVFSAIDTQVETSLNEAEGNWGRFTDTGKGVIDTAYELATGNQMPDDLRKSVEIILDKNIKLFNGIVENNTIDIEGGFFCPGWRDVEWVWWNFDNLPNAIDVNNQEVVPLRKMILNSLLEQTQKKTDDFEKEHFVTDGAAPDLFGSNKNWDTKENGKVHTKLIKEVEEIEKKLQSL